MADSCTTVAALALLIFVVIRGSNGDKENSLTLRDSTMVDALKQNSEALHCFGDVVKDGLHSLSDDLSQVKEQINTLNGKFDTVKIENDDSQKVDKLNQVIDDLKNQLSTKDQMVAAFSQEIADLKSQLIEKDNSVAACSQKEKDLTLQFSTKDQEVAAISQAKKDLETQLGNKDQTVLDLNNKLGESQQRVKELEQKVKDLSNTVEPQNLPAWMKDCVQPANIQQIRSVVKTFNDNGDFESLKRGLEPLLDRSSGMLAMLQRAQSLNELGCQGSTPLVSLLLCAGMVADTSDSNNGRVILDGAAENGQVQLVKLLLDRGASPNGVSVWNIPLFDAAYNGHLEVVKLLVQAGADTTRRNVLGLSALDWANSGGATAVKQYLQQFPQ